MAQLSGRLEVAFASCAATGRQIEKVPQRTTADHRKAWDEFDVINRMALPSGAATGGISGH
jgi:hypothetical protein